MAATGAEKLLTLEEYLALPDDGKLNELVCGRIVPLTVPTPRHGQICSNVAYSLGTCAEEHDRGHVVSNHSGIITRRNPDTVRGADLAFYSYHRVPPGPIPEGFLSVMPELVIEVRSPTDRWSQILARVAEYLEAGVMVVCVLDEQSETCCVYRSEEPEEVLPADHELTIPEVLPEFRVPVRRFFE